MELYFKLKDNDYKIKIRKKVLDVICRIENKNAVNVE